jgi:hypothetical protein
VEAEGIPVIPGSLGYRSVSPPSWSEVRKDPSLSGWDFFLCFFFVPVCFNDAGFFLGGN